MQPGAVVTAAFSATTCRNLFGLALAQQYQVTATQQLSFSIQYTSSATAALVPLHIGASFHPPVTRSATPYIIVMRPGTFGFLMSAPAASTASYVVRTSRDPDSRQACTTTYVTRGVRFSSALTSACGERDIRVVDLIERSQSITVSITTPGRPVELELIDAETGDDIDDAKVTPSRRTATITWTNRGRATRVLLRISGDDVNDLVTIDIAP